MDSFLKELYGMHILDTSLAKKTQLGVNVSNLLGKKYRVYSGMPEIGTSAVASLKYQF